MRVLLQYEQPEDWPYREKDMGKYGLENAEWKVSLSYTQHAAVENPFLTHRQHRLV